MRAPPSPVSSFLPSLCLEQFSSAGSERIVGRVRTRKDVKAVSPPPNRHAVSLRIPLFGTSQINTIDYERLRDNRLWSETLRSVLSPWAGIDYILRMNSVGCFVSHFMLQLVARFW